MSNKLYLFAFAAILMTCMITTPAFAFDVNLVDVSIQDAFVTEYTDYDIITAIFSIFNGDTQTANLSGHNMIYLNDTNADWWEYSNYSDYDGISESDCPHLDVSITSGNSTDVKLCFLVQHDATIGYSVIVNNDENLMDMDIKEFTLEHVPDWFKTTAGGWCTDAITESEFANSIQSYIQVDTIKVLRGQSVEDVGTQTPAWVKAAACDWSNNAISDYEFLDGIYWLIDNGKIQLD